MGLSKSLAWVAFVVILGLTGLGKDHPAAPDSKPTDARASKIQVAQHATKKVVGPAADRPVSLLRASAP